MSFVAGCLNVMAMMFTMRSNLALLGGPSGLSFHVPLVSIPVIVAGAALLALFIAAGMLILASFARTFKEGQSLVSPFMIAFVLPLLFIQSPSQEFTIRVAFIPVVNVAMMFRQAIGGYFDWKPMAITVAMEILFVTAALKIATTLVEREDFMMDSSGGAFLRFIRTIWTQRSQRRGNRCRLNASEQTPLSSSATSRRPFSTNRAGRFERWTASASNAAKAKFSAFSEPTEPARRQRCACCPRSSRPLPAPPEFWATTS